MKRYVHLLRVVYSSLACLTATRAAQPDEVRADPRQQLAESRSGRVVRGAGAYGVTSYCRRPRVSRSIMNSHARCTLSLKFRVFVAVVSRTLAPAKHIDAKKSLSVTAQLILPARVRNSSLLDAE